MALTRLHFEWLGFALIACFFAALLITIVIALYRKDHVKTGMWLRSFGFFLEAGNDTTPKTQ